MTRKVCVVTGSRAEYGLLRWVIDGIRESATLQLQIVVTGMHLSPEFGLTYREIEKDGHVIDRKVETLLSCDTQTGISKSMGLGLIGFGETLAELHPDLMVVVGDRYEIFAAVVAATIARIPVAHLHGGEITEGAFDESMRHSITKMSHLHFVAAEAYRNRVIQLGEDPDRVFLVGGLGVDAIKRTRLFDRDELEGALGFRLGEKNLVVTFHPATLEDASSSHQLSELLASLDALTDTHLIFTMPNADTGTRGLFTLIEEFVGDHANACAFTSLGHALYLSCVRHADGVVGNSSSGLTEVPSFKKGTINIGTRQQGRLKADSVLDCDPNRLSIDAALRRLFSPEFQESLATVRNPYGEGGASEQIVQILQTVPLDSILTKRFFDLPR